MPKRRTTDPEVIRRIQRGLLETRNPNASMIRRRLLEDEDLAAKVPSLRTVQSIVKEIWPELTTGPWTIANATPIEVETVLPVATAVRERSAKALTNEEAEYVMKVRRAAPDLPPFAVYGIAFLYMQRKTAEKGASDVDWLLGTHPWRGGEDARRFGDLTLWRRTGWLSVEVPSDLHLARPRLGDGDDVIALEFVPARVGRPTEDGPGAGGPRKYRTSRAKVAERLGFDPDLLFALWRERGDLLATYAGVCADVGETRGVDTAEEGPDMLFVPLRGGRDKAKREGEHGEA